MLELLERPETATAPGLDALACPDAASGEMARCIVGSYAPAILAIAIERVEGGGELAAFLSDHLDQVDGALGWDRAFGAVHDALAGLGSLHAALAEVALRLSAAGTEGTWRVRLARPVRWRFANLLLPPTRALAVEVAAGSARITLDDGPVLHLRGDGITWHAPYSSGVALPLDTVSLGPNHLRAALCPGAGLFPFSAELHPKLLPLPLPPLWIATVQAALDQLRYAAPAYADWVADAVRYIVPCRADADTLSSGSSSRMLGVVRITSDLRPEAIVEMLVHEASHQYFYVAGLTGDFADPADKRLFFSPAKQTGRPIDKILLAYHAFANVEAAFAGCLRVGAGNPGYYGPQFERLVGELDLMEDHLCTAGSLTPLGHALADRLIARRGRR